MVLTIVTLTCMKVRSRLANVCLLAPGVAAAFFYLYLAIMPGAGSAIRWGLALAICSFVLMVSYARIRRTQVLNERLRVVHTRKQDDGESLFLPDLLRDGTIRLVRVRWLLSITRLHRRQELEAKCPEAFVPPEEAVLLFQASKVAVLSYRWLTAACPDPQSFHLKALQAYARSHHGRRHCAIFIDFCSCFQNSEEAKAQGEQDRTADENEGFKKALMVMTCLYASPLTIVIQHRQLPPAPMLGWDSRSYGRSGWCNMEQASAFLMAEGGIKLYELDGLGLTPRRLRPFERQQQYTPEAMSDFFLAEDPARCDFFGRSDRVMVANMYKEFFEKMAAFDQQHQRCLAQVANRFVQGLYTQLSHDRTEEEALRHTTVLIALLFFVVIPLLLVEWLVNSLRVVIASDHSEFFFIPAFIFCLLVLLVSLPLNSELMRTSLICYASDIWHGATHRCFGRSRSDPRSLDTRAPETVDDGDPLVPSRPNTSTVHV
jgi:hypothetical protein